MKISAIGEILYDVYSAGKILGGAPFNFAYHIKQITGNSNFISCIGNDSNGAEILDFLSDSGFNTNYISIDRFHPTGTVMVQMLPDKTPKFEITENCAYDFMEVDLKINDLIENKTDLLYFGTLARRNYSSEKAVRSLLGKNIRYFCDLNIRQNFYTKEIIEESLIASNVIKLNRNELALLGRIFSLPDDIEQAAIEIHGIFDLDLICITLDIDGSLLYDGVTLDLHPSGHAKIIDTLGAGDAFSSILALGYLFKLDLHKINSLANRFASEICQIQGAIPSNNEIYQKYIREFNNEKK